MKKEVKRIIERAWVTRNYEEDTDTSDCCGFDRALLSDICSNCGEHAEFE